MFTEKSVSDDAFGVGVERDWPKYGKLRPHVRHRFSDVLELEVARINLADTRDRATRAQIPQRPGATS